MKRLDIDYKRLGRTKTNTNETNKVSRKKPNRIVNRDSQRSGIEDIKRRRRRESEKSRKDMKRTSKAGKDRKVKVINKGKRERERNAELSKSDELISNKNKRTTPSNRKKNTIYTRVGITEISSRNNNRKESLETSKRERKGRSLYDSDNKGSFKWLRVQKEVEVGIVDTRTSKSRSKNDRIERRNWNRSRDRNTEMTRQSRSSYNRGKSIAHIGNTRSQTGRRRKGRRVRIIRIRKYRSEKKQKETS